MRVALITTIMTETGGAKKSLRSRDNTQNALSWVGPWSRGLGNWNKAWTSVASKYPY